MTNLRAGLQRDLAVFMDDFYNFAGKNKQRQTAYLRLTNGLIIGNLVNLRSAVRGASRLAGNAGRKELFDQGVTIAHQLNQLIEGADQDAA